MDPIATATRPVRILYLFPDRASSASRLWEQSCFWPAYEKVALQCGLAFGVAVPEHVVLSTDSAHWNGELLDPARDVIVYDIRSGPVHDIDLWTSITLVRSLEALGFWTAIRLDDAVLFNDKHATAVELAGSPVPLIPSVRVTTGRDTDRLSYQELVPDDWFPVFTKPASWGRGLGCVLCPDRATLDAVLGLASGSGACMLVQPSVGEVVADTRVVAVEGRVVAAYDRIPTGSAHAANVSRGATVRPRVHVESALHELVALVHERFDLPYVCVDVLVNARGELYLSELELDGAVSALFDDPDAMDRVVGGRFRAYAARLEEHSRERPLTATSASGARA